MKKKILICILITTLMITSGLVSATKIIDDDGKEFKTMNESEGDTKYCLSIEIRDIDGPDNDPSPNVIGRVRLDPPGDGVIERDSQLWYDKGTVITLTAIPEENYVLERWDEDGEPERHNQQIIITMDTGHHIVAKFQRIPENNKPPNLYIDYAYNGLAKTVYIKINRADPGQPEIQKLFVEIEWSDGQEYWRDPAEGFGYGLFSKEVTRSLSEFSVGTHTVTVRAGDEYGAITEEIFTFVKHSWQSKPAVTSMFDRILELFPNISFFLRQILNS